jgi:hypothetical protein
MKKLMFVLLILYFAFSVNAQWWYHEYNVSSINDLSQDQLNLSLKEINKDIKRALLMTGIGSGICIAGIGILTKPTNSEVVRNYRKVIGSTIAGLGGLLTVEAIINLIIGESRKHDIKVASVKFKPTTSINGIGVKIRF